MSIKPVAEVKDGQLVVSRLPEGFTGHLYAIPDTHRVVPVELLEHLRALMVIYQIDYTEEQIGAIIEDK